MQRSLICFAVIAVGAATTAQGVTIHVDASAPLGGDGSSWDTAFRFLQDALDAAELSPGADEIRVAQGLYRPDRDEPNPLGTGDRLATFGLLDDTTLLGGYVGLAGDDPDEREPERFRSVLTGDLSNNDGDANPEMVGDNAYHVIESWGNADTCVVDGFVIRDGQADRPFDQGWWPTRRDDSAGGALVVESNAVFRGCLFTDNHADANASVWVALSGPFAGAEAGSGAVMIAGGAPTFEDCVFHANSASRVAGALGINRSSARITRCEFTGNRIGLAGFPDVNYGGAIGDFSADFSTPERARVESCRFVNNSQSGPGGGGAVFTIFSDTVYANCVFLANHAEDVGGGIMADNIANVHFHNCAIVGNTAERVCAGVYEFSEVGDTYLFANCLVWGNTVSQLIPRNPNMVSEGGNFALYDSIIEDIFTRPVFFFDANRLFDDNPEFTDPVGPDGVAWSGDENLRPAPTSPAIDLGNSSRVPAWFATDLDGKPRFLDAPTIPDLGVGPAPIVDMGPFEAGPGCNPADNAAPFGVLDLEDVQGFVAAFVDQQAAADIAPPFGVFDLSDVQAFVAAFLAGCP